MPVSARKNTENAAADLYPQRSATTPGGALLVVAAAMMSFSYFVLFAKYRIEK